MVEQQRLRNLGIRYRQGLQVRPCRRAALERAGVADGPGISLPSTITVGLLKWRQKRDRLGCRYRYLHSSFKQHWSTGCSASIRRDGPGPRTVQQQSEFLAR